MRGEEKTKIAVDNRGYSGHVNAQDVGGASFSLTHVLRERCGRESGAAAARPVQKEIAADHIFRSPSQIALIRPMCQSHTARNQRVPMFYPDHHSHKLTVFWSLGKVSMEHLELFSKVRILEYLIWTLFKPSSGTSWPEFLNQIRSEVWAVNLSWSKVEHVMCVAFETRSNKWCASIHRLTSGPAHAFSEYFHFILKGIYLEQLLIQVLFIHLILLLLIRGSL